MLMSMTGFGKASGSHQSKKVSVEIRSLNSKSIDLNVRMPQRYKELDADVRKHVSNALGRGKVDVTISMDSIGEESSVSINQGLAKKYYEELKSLGKALNEESEDYLSLVLRMPEVMESKTAALEEEEVVWLMDLLAEATENLCDFRRKEGKELEQEFMTRISDIRNFLKEIPNYEDERISVIRERMRKGLEEIDGGYDANRFEQEMIFYLEKLDISEEKMRLSNHLDYFEETMRNEGSGKKLGFITQEIGREINTLGSKSNHAKMQKLVIGMKDALEKIKEQILNTL
ncbi:MAG: YicC/YloC family endoribonuclease [Fluviicola sp.]